MVELTASGETTGTMTATLTDAPKLTASGETTGTMTATLTDAPKLTASGETTGTITATMGLVSGLSTEGEITATVADSIAVLSKERTEEETRLPVADIIDAIRVLLDEMAHAISFYTLIIATVYSANRILTVIPSYICERRTRDMPMLRVVCRLLGHLTSV